MYTIRTVKILIKLLPSILALRKDRKKWINQNKNKIDLNIRFDLIYVEKDLKSFKFTHYKEIFIPTID